MPIESPKVTKPVSRRDPAEDRERQMKIPEGWLSAAEIAETCEVTYQTILWVIQRLREKNEIRVGEVKGLKRARADKWFYAPRIVEIITDLLSIKKPPDGWRTRKEIAEALNLNLKAVKARVERLRKRRLIKHKDQMKQRTPRRPWRITLLSPKAVEYISRVTPRGQKKNIDSSLPS